jgi:DNA adenine methylase
MNLPQPIPYQGSKRRIAMKILRFFPAKIERLVEPFAGSAAISVAAAACHLTSSFWINDAHKPLIDLWQKIINHTEELAKDYENHWNAQQGQEQYYFNTIRTQFNKRGEPADFLYLLVRCVKAAIRYNSKGEFNNTPDNRRKGATPNEMQRRLQQVATLLKGKIQLSSVHYAEILERCNENDLIYMDPPYQGVCKNRDQRYCPPFKHDEFCEYIKRLNVKNFRFIISYDGRTGKKVYGESLPDNLGLTRFEIEAGRSSQATLLGRNEKTIESLYISKQLMKTIKKNQKIQIQIPLLFQ